MNEMSDGNQRISLRLQQYRVNRRKFALKAYSIATVFSVLTVVQWVFVFKMKMISDLYEEHFYISMIFLLCGLVLISVFVFVEHFRFMTPFNCIFAILIVECVTFGLARIVINTTLMLFLVSVGLAGLCVVIFLAIGILMSHDLTLDVVILFLCSVIFFIGSVFFVALHIIVFVDHAMDLYSCFVLAAVISFIMYHGQTINGSRYAEMRLNDYWLAALIVYHDFVILFVVLYYLCGKIWEKSSSEDEKIIDNNLDYY